MKRQLLVTGIAVAMLAAWSNSLSDEAATVGTRVDLRPEPPWSFSAHLGLNSPQGSFGNFYDGGPSIGLDVEYRLNQQYAAELFVGYDSFDGSSGLPDVDASQVSLNGKYYFPLGSSEGYALAGIGSYNFDPGPTENGVNIGVGFQTLVNSNYAWGVSLKYHIVDTSGSSLDFYTLQGVVRF